MTNKVELKLALDGKAEVIGGIRDVGQQMRESSQTMTQAVAATDVKVKELGMSVKQLNAATRGIGPQFTDIFTGLASGQAPMTVLIQQGGQLKDMFGGVVPAAKALGGYVAGLINPVALAAGALGGLAYAAYQGSKETDTYTRSIVMTGNASGVTAGQLGDMARRMSEVRGTQANAAAALAEMVGTGRVAREDLQKFSQVAVDMERTVGQSVAETAKTFADLAKDPVTASLKLNETLGYLTAATYAQIKAAKEMGEDERAASLAGNAAADALATRTAQMEGSLGTLERAWLNVKKAVTSTIDSMLSVGRVSSISQQLAEIRGEIEQRKGLDKNRPSTLPWEESLSSLQQRQAYLQEQLRLEQRGAEAASARAAVNRAGVEAVDKVTAANTKALTKQEQMNKALTEYRNAIADIRTADPNSALLDPKKIAAAEEGIRRQYKEGKSAAEAELEKEAALMAKLSGVNADYQEQLKRLQTIRDKTNMSEERYVELVKQLIAEQPGVKKQMEDEAKALKELMDARQQSRAKEAASIAAFLEAQTEAASKSLKSVADRVQALQDEESAVAISQKQNVSLAQAIEMVAIARLQEEQARKFVPGYEGWEAIQREIDKHKELLGLMNTKDLREKEQSGWLAFYNSLDSTARQTFTNVLEGGQGIWTKLRNTAKSVFFDWLYQMTAKKWLFNLTVSASGGALPASANAASGIGSLASTGSSLYGIGSAVVGGGMSVANATGSMLANVTETGLDGLLATNGAFGTASGMAGAMSPVLEGLMTAAPYLAAIAGVYMLAKNLDHSGTPHSGGSSAYSATGGLSSTRVGGWTGGSTFGDSFGSVVGTADATSMTAQIAQSIVGILDGTASAFGQKAGYYAATSFADDSSKDGAWGSLLLKMGDTVLADWNDTRTSKWAPRVFSDGSAGSAEYLAAISADVRAVFNSIDMPAWAAKIRASLGDAASLEQLSAAAEKIASIQNAINAQRAGLQQTLDLLTGVTTQREIERAALDESNRALYDQITALQDKQAADEEAAQAQKTAAEEAARATERAAEAMKDAMASVNEEADRLRGVMTADSPAALTALLAQFATGTAQARAGDVAAMQALAGLSQSIEEASISRATSAVDVARTRAWLAGSLSATAGISPGAIYSSMPGAQSGVTSTATATSIDALIQRLTQEIEGLRAEARATAEATSKTARLIDRAMPDGDALATREAAAL